MHKIAAIQMNSGADATENCKQAVALIAKAARQGAVCAVLPEMFASLGILTDQSTSVFENFGDGPIQTIIAQAARENNIWVVAGTIALNTNIPNKKAAACIVYNSNGEVVTRYDKIHLFDANLPNNESYKESRTTLAGTECIVFDSPFGRVGLAVCYDLRFPLLFEEMSRRGAELFIVPVAFIYMTGLAHWEILVRARAIENLSYMICAAQTGNHPNERRTYGHSCIINPWGEIIAENSLDQIGTTTANIDIALCHELRKQLPTHSHRVIKPDLSSL